MKTKTSFRRLAGALALGVFGLGSFSARAAGPLSELYLTVGETNLAGIQGTTVLFNVAQSPTGQFQSPLAVNSTVRTIGDSSGETGREYTLTGTSMGTSYSQPAVLGGDSVYDGTSDGSWNYVWDYDTGTAYKFGLDWSGGTSLFSIGTSAGNRMGIAHDRSNNSLWVSGYYGTAGTLISNFSLTGTLLSSFNVPHLLNAALALDPADGTLWLNSVGVATSSTTTLEQFARSLAGSFGGTESPLSTQVYGVNGFTFGGDFQSVPEPTTWVMLLGGLGLLGCVQRFRGTGNR